MAVLVVGALAALALTAVPAEAARYRGGYRGGYSPGYTNWGYSPGYYGSNWGYNNFYRPGISIGIGASPYYGTSGYYSSPYYSSPSYYSSSGYYSEPSYYYSPPMTVAPSYNSTTVAPSYNSAPAAADDRAHIDVRVPAPDAEVFFDGDPTQQRGTDRTFASPPLPAGRTFTYNIEARWMENGRMVDRTQSVTVSAGQSSTVDFTASR